MKINTTKAVSFSLLFISITVGTAVHALGNGNSAQLADSLPTPFPLLNLPTMPPPTLPQNIGSADFLDHSIPAGFGIIKGKVIDDSTGGTLANARITIPELKISTRSDKNGNFAFAAIQVGTVPGAELDVTLEAQVPGYGKHTMVNVGVFSQDTATVLLTLKRGSAPTRWFGLVSKKGQSKSAQAPLALTDFSAPAESLVSNPLPFSSVVSGPLTFSASATSPPPYIRIGILPLDSNGRSTSNTPIRIDTVDFTFYVKHVLGNEWGTGTSWGPESLKAGAMAVKEYGWYHVIHPKPPSSGRDCDNSYDTCQLYNPYISWSSTDKAVDTMSSTGWYQNGAIFESQFCAGAVGDTSTSACGFELNKMSQEGSKSWAAAGKSYSWILDYYYSASGTITYFSYSPRPPLVYVATSTPTTIRLNYSSASSTNYEVWRWVISAWQLQYGPGPLTTFQDPLLVGGTTYSYAVFATSPDGVWWSNGYPNGGYITALAAWPSSIPSATTDAFFAATSTIRISATSTTPNIDSWLVDKWDTASSIWKLKYNGMPPSATSSTDKVNSTNDFPSPAYIDNTPNGGGKGKFVYVDTGLTQNTQYFYTIAYHTSKGWSDFSNNNGSVGPKTDDSE